MVDNQIGSPTYAKDLAELVLNMCVGEKWDFGLYHFSNSGATTWFDFAAEIFVQIGSDCKVLPISSEDFGSKARRPKYSVLIDPRIPDEFSKPWQESLALCLKNMGEPPMI